jgi:hypothetical protein
MSERKGRPRRVLALALGLFVVVQLGFGLCLDYAFPLLRFTSFRDVLAKLQSERIQPDVLILGSSRLQAAVNEREARHLTPLGVLNAAVPAGDPTAQEVILDKLLTAGVRPRRVLLEVSPEFFNGMNFCAGWNGLRLHRWHDLPRHLGQIAATPQRFQVLRSRLLPVYEFREQLWSELSGRHRPLDAVPLALGPVPPHATIDPGRLPPIRPSQTEEMRAAMLSGGRFAGTSWLRGYRVQRLNVDALKRTVARCRDLGCEVVLITPPLSSPHRVNYTPAIEEAYQAVLREVGCGHVDCRDWMPDEHFMDSHHLTPDGGRAFTRRFAAEVLGR